MQFVVDKIESSATIRLIIQAALILLFVGGAWANYKRDSADFKKKDASHDEQIMKLTGLVEANAVAIGELTANTKSELRLQEYRNDAFHEKDQDYESRLRRMERSER